MIWELFAAGALLFACGALAGYKLAWMDAYDRGRKDALKPFRPIAFGGLRW